MTQSAAAAATWYSIRQRAPVASAAQGALAAAEIFIYGDIGESWWDETVSAAQFVKDLNALAADQITIRINSQGGSVPDGIAIHNAIKRHKATTTTIVDGMALSIASLIALAGDTVEMAENAVMMIHAPWTVAAGNAVEMRTTADLLDTWAAAMATSYAAKSGQSVDAITALLTDGADHWYTAAEALDAGFVDAVTTALPIAAAHAAAGNAATRYPSMPAAIAAGLAPRAPVAAPAASPQPVAAATNPPENLMTQPATPAAPVQGAAPVAAAEVSAIQAAALAADGERRTAIRNAFTPFMAREGVSALAATCADDVNCSAADAGQRLLAHLAKGATSVAGHIVTVEDESDKRRFAVVDALMVRAGTASDEQRRNVQAYNPFKGKTLLDLASASLQRAGVKVDNMDKMAIVGSAFTQGTSDFPILLENTMRKTLQQAYALAADTWTRFCARGTVSDFRANNRYRVGSLGNLDSKTELGEFKSKAIPDGEKAQITAATKGNIITLSREAIINDDLGAFVGLAAMLGRAAKRTVETDVYATLALNSGLGPTLGDGYSLFHANHNNITTGAALSAAAIDLDRVAMASQKDVSSNDYLDLRPQVLLVPMSLGGTAKSINMAEYDPDTANKLQKPNTVRGLFGDIVDTPRLSGTRRYLFASTTEAPVLEVAFLDGNDTPYLELEQGFTVDGSRWKVRLDYGIAGVDYRGAITNAGA